MASFIKDFTSAAAAERFKEMVEGSPALKVLGYMLGPERVLEYAHSVAVEDPKLRSLVPPIPPHELRVIVAAPEEPIFLWTGAVDANLFMGLFARHGAAPARADVFDFGCGCGRLTRYLGAVERYRVFASDINPQLVTWCRDNLKQVDTRLNDARPPLPFDDRQFDFVYSLSIFTHLPEHLAKLWLGEIARTLKPGGIFAFTTHGLMALDIVEASQAHRAMFAIAADQMEEIRRNFTQAGFAYLSYSPVAIDAAHAGDEYGNSFVAEARVRDHWIDKEIWELAEFIPGGLRGWQDVVVLRRK